MSALSSDLSFANPLYYGVVIYGDRPVCIRSRHGEPMGLRRRGIGEKRWDG